MFNIDLTDEARDFRRLYNRTFCSLGGVRWHKQWSSTVSNQSHHYYYTEQCKYSYT